MRSVNKQLLTAKEIPPFISSNFHISVELTNRICYTMELDEKYASVILRRYVEDTGDADNVYVIRNGEKLMYADLVKEVDFPE